MEEAPEVKIRGWNVGTILETKIASMRLSFLREAKLMDERFKRMKIKDLKHDEESFFEIGSKEENQWTIVLLHEMEKNLEAVERDDGLKYRLFIRNLDNYIPDGPYAFSKTWRRVTVSLEFPVHYEWK